MTPIEYLLPVNERSEDEIGCLTILKLNWMLLTSKKACAEVNAIKRILDIMKENIRKVCLFHIFKKCIINLQLN